MNTEKILLENGIEVYVQKEEPYKWAAWSSIHDGIVCEASNRDEVIEEAISQWGS